MAITTIEKHTVKTHGVKFDKEFQILATPHAFHALSSSIYSQKIPSIIRELGTNSYDSHVEAGKKDEPFVVHCPTSFEPYYECRDYGIGLSQEEVTNLYSIYFKSGVNRCKSNDFVSVFGVGSKSPFAYQPSFTVTSWQNGKQSNYSCYTDEDGYPRVSLLGTNKSEEPDGLSVKFSVKSGDVWEFRGALPRIFSYFHTIPKIVGASISVEPVKYSVRTADYGIRSGETYGELRAVMGNIAYPVSQSNLPDIKNSKIFQSNIDLFFNIGEIEPAISRETLSYNKATIKAVTDKINQVLNTIQDEIETKLKNAVSLYEARCITYNDIIKQNASGLIDYRNLKWQGKQIGDRDTAFTTDDIVAKRVYIHDTRNRTQTKIRHSIYTLSIGNEIWENDLPNNGRGGMPRLRNYVRDNKKTCLYIEFQNAAARATFIKEMGCNDTDIKKISSLPKPVPAKYNRGGGGFTYAMKGKVFKFRNTVARSHYQNWEEIDPKNIDDSKVTYIYVPIKGYELDETCGLKEFKDLSLVISGVELFIKGTPIIYGVRKDVIKKLGKNWKKFDEYIKETITLKDTQKLYRQIKARNEFRQNSGELGAVLKKIHLHTKLKSSKCHFMINLWKFWADPKNNESALIAMADFVRYKFNKSSLRLHVSQIIKQFYSWYPMIKVIMETYYYNNVNSTSLNQYVEQMDRLRQLNQF